MYSIGKELWNVASLAFTIALLLTYTFVGEPNFVNVYIQDTATTLRYEHTEILNLFLLYVLS